MIGEVSNCTWRQTLFAPLVIVVVLLPRHQVALAQQAVVSASERPQQSADDLSMSANADGTLGDGIPGDGNVQAAPWRASCSTSTCHGGIEGRGPAWSHSLSVFLARDPHAGAGRLLRDDDSRLIVHRLDAEAASDAEAFERVLQTRCISCHTSALADDCRADAPLNESLLGRGVHCESCHGSADKWLDSHMKKSWSGPDRFDPSTGMRDTESILGRATTCVRCHIGSRTQDGVVRDMNHDLIAAGHPALRFDLLLYQDNLPKHWDVEGEPERAYRESALRVRQVGRAINLVAAASLAAQRATDHLRDSSAVPWPELSDYDCFACHQSLSMREYLLPRRAGQGMKSSLHVSDGLPVWNSWHTIGNELEIRENRRALEALSPQGSDPAQMASLAGQIAERFRQKADQRMGQSASDLDIIQAARDLVESVRGQLLQSAPVDWHQAAIQFLDLDAAARDLSRFPQSESQGRSLVESLASIERLLRFDGDDETTRTEHLHSPADFDPDEFRARLLNLLNAWITTQAQADPQGAVIKSQSEHSKSVGPKT